MCGLDQGKVILAYNAVGGAFIGGTLAAAIGIFLYWTI